MEKKQEEKEKKKKEEEKKKKKKKKKNRAIAWRIQTEPRNASEQEVHRRGLEFGTSALDVLVLQKQQVTAGERLRYGHSSTDCERAGGPTET